MLIRPSHLLPALVLSAGLFGLSAKGAVIDVVSATSTTRWGYWTAAARRNKLPLVIAPLGLASVLAIGAAAHRSIDEGRPVMLDEFLR